MIRMRVPIGDDLDAQWTDLLCEIGLASTRIVTERDVTMKRRSVSKSARHRRIPFDLSREVIRRLLEQPVCAMCGVAFVPGNPMTIERHDPLLGYTPDNVCAAHAACNARKNVREDHRRVMQKRRRA